MDNLFQHTINVTKANGGFGSVAGTITVNVLADLAGNEFTIVDETGGAIKFTQDGGELLSIRFQYSNLQCR